MSYLIAQKNLLSEDLKQLISHITGFDETLDAFCTIENYAWSLLVHYNCPSIDKNTIKKRLLGFVEKFKIHAYSFPQKAKNLELLFERYLEIHYYEEDVLWGLLYFLLILSKRPTDALEDDKPLVFPLYQPEQEEESFDWAAYLKEDVPHYSFAASDEEILCGEDITSTRNAKSLTKLNEHNEKHTFSKHFINLSNNTVDLHAPGHSILTCESATAYSSEIRSNEKTPSDTIRENKAALTKEELKIALLAKDAYKRSNLLWWTNPLLREKPHSKMPIPIACFTWEQNISLRGITIGETRTLSEAKAIKELISVICHPRECFIFKKYEGGYKPREKVSISSTNPVDFYNALLEICPYLSIIENINKFNGAIDSLAIGFSGHGIVPNTYVAYSSALKDIMTSLNVFLNILESYTNEQAFVYMISYLMVEIRPWLKHLKFLYDIHRKAIDWDWKTQENWICAVRLLAVLYESLEYTNGWNKLNLTIIFLKSIRPYFNILETWLVHFKYSDHRDEFLITRSSHQICEGNIVVRDYQSVLSNIDIQRSLFIDNFVYYSIRACSSVDFQLVLHKNSFHDGPIEEEFNAIYIEFLKSLIEDIQDGCVLLEKTIISHKTMIIKKINSLIAANNNRDQTSSNYTHKGDERICSPESWNGYSFVSNDNIFKFAFSSFNHPINLNNIYAQGDNFHISEYFKKLEYTDIESAEIAKLVKEHFTTVISERMQPKGFAKNTLLYDYRLLEHIHVIKSVYLFLDGVTMNIFSKSLFSKVFTNNLKAISWTNELRELLYNDYPAYYSNFSLGLPYNNLKFILNNSEFSYPDFIEFSSQINISYMLQPPLNLVITSESIEKYNDLFHLFLQTKWALSCLSNLSFKDLLKGKNNTKSARLISLRLFLLHNVQTFEKYFISINSEDFDGEMIQVCSVARDIHVIANAHDKILNQLRKHCFLVGAPKILDCIVTIFRLCQTFSSLWKMTLQAHYIKSMNELSTFEVKYQDCINELTNNLLQIGKDHIFKNNVNFSYLCDELFNNMPGDW